MTLELLPKREKSVRCRHCHLTIKPRELANGYCPECFATTAKKRYDFEDMEQAEVDKVRYRCEDCGVIVSTR